MNHTNRHEKYFTRKQNSQWKVSFLNNKNKQPKKMIIKTFNWKFVFFSIKNQSRFSSNRSFHQISLLFLIHWHLIKITITFEIVIEYFLLEQNKQIEIISIQTKQINKAQFIQQRDTENMKQNYTDIFSQLSRREFSHLSREFNKKIVWNQYRRIVTWQRWRD